MRSRWVFWGMMLGVGALLWLLGVGLTRDPAHVPSPLVEQEAPAFSFSLLRPAADASGEGSASERPAGEHSAEVFSLAGVRGRPVILNFWASWCTACRAEASVLQTASERWRGLDLVVVGVAVQDTPLAARRFAEAFGKTYPLGLDNAAGDIALSYGVYGVPETFFIGRDGVIYHKHVGPVDEPTLQAHLLPLLTALDDPTGYPLNRKVVAEHAARQDADHDHDAHDHADHAAGQDVDHTDHDHAARDHAGPADHAARQDTEHADHDHDAHDHAGPAEHAAEQDHADHDHTAHDHADHDAGQDVDHTDHDHDAESER